MYRTKRRKKTNRIGERQESEEKRSEIQVDNLTVESKLREKEEIAKSRRLQFDEVLEVPR